MYRKVPSGYKYLSFDAKITYASKYAEKVWSSSLIYDNMKTAAVGPENQPFDVDRLDVDDAGNVVSYMGTSIERLKQAGYPNKDSWRAKQSAMKQGDRLAELQSQRNSEIRKEKDEVGRLAREQKEYEYQKDSARIQKGTEEAWQKVKEDADRTAKEAAERKAKEGNKDKNGDDPRDPNDNKWTHTNSGAYNDPNDDRWNQKPYYGPDAPLALVCI